MTPTAVPEGMAVAERERAKWLVGELAIVEDRLVRALAAVGVECGVAQTATSDLQVSIGVDDARRLVELIERSPRG